jgi:hypothetical protein
MGTGKSRLIDYEVARSKIPQLADLIEAGYNFTGRGTLPPSNAPSSSSSSSRHGGGRRDGGGGGKASEDAGIGFDLFRRMFVEPVFPAMPDVTAKRLFQGLRGGAAAGQALQKEDFVCGVAVMVCGTQQQRAELLSRCYGRKDGTIDLKTLQEVRMVLLGLLLLVSAVLVSVVLVSAVVSGGIARGVAFGRKRGECGRSRSALPNDPRPPIPLALQVSSEVLSKDMDRAKRNADASVTLERAFRNKNSDSHVSDALTVEEFQELASRDAHAQAPAVAWLEKLGRTLVAASRPGGYRHGSHMQNKRSTLAILQRTTRFSPQQIDAIGNAVQLIKQRYRWVAGWGLRGPCAVGGAVGAAWC